MSLSALLRRRPRLGDGDVVEVAGRPVRLAVNTRARRIALRLDGARREVVATAPSLSRLSEALAFAQTRADWIADRLDALPPSHPFRPGGVIPFRGAPCRLERAAMRITPRLAPATPAEPARLIASGDGDAYARAVLRALKREALGRLEARTREVVAGMNLPMPQVAVGDARGRWGSCRAPHGGDHGRIRYGWRLICAPDFVSDYVVAHECAHLVQPNHSADFWAVTASLYGDVTAARRWLKTHGGALQALGG